ncbi:ABC transporter substrate-binding protein [Gracilaria domingensis]|nr:ABC transporter substrate-binding protein [Gracilaria domingensis]
MDSVVSPFQPDPKAQKQFEKLSSVRCGKVWGREKRISEDGQANDYFESGVFQPDEILKDLVSILHPNVDFGGREEYYMHFYKPDTSKYTSTCPYNDFITTPGSGEVYVDTLFSVSGRDRFEIEDVWETKIEPELKKLKLPAAFDMLFKADNVDSSDTFFMLRARVDKGEENSLGQPEELRTALERSLGTEVVLRKNEESQQGNKRGPSRAVIGIIIAVVLILIILAALCVRRRRQRKALNNLPIERIPGAKQEPWSEIEGIEAA